MKIKHRENLTKTERLECCLKTFEMLTPSGKSWNFDTPAFSP
jgi:hypothetical protein